MSFIQAIYYLFFPKTCVFCDAHLSQNEEILCATCRHRLPTTDFIDSPNNIVEKSFEGRTPIVAGTALLYFAKKGISQKLIHDLKYRNRQDIGVFFGKWMGKQIRNSARFATVEGLILVPIHPKKMKSRGYNQLTTFGVQLSKELGVSVFQNVLQKKEDKKSQTQKNRLSRFEKISDSFKLDNSSAIAGKHVLLLDDVITTGATLEACVNELLKVPGTSVSIATMVVADNL